MRIGFRLVVSLVLLSALLTALWTWWAESHPQGERELRVLVQDQLHEWFPEEMAPASRVYGLFPRFSKTAAGTAPLEK